MIAALFCNYGKECHYWLHFSQHHDGNPYGKQRAESARQPLLSHGIHRTIPRASESFPY